MGLTLREAYEKTLWRVQVQKNGEVGYPSFQRYVEVHLGISQATAYNLMDVVKSFTAAQVKEFGPTKLLWILKAPEKARADLMRALASGISKRELVGVVRLARRKAGIVSRITGRKVFGNIGRSRTFFETAIDVRPFLRGKISSDACFYCRKTKVHMHLEHVIPISRGGIDSPVNTVQACAKCNLSKGARIPSEWRSDLPLYVLKLESELLKMHTNRDYRTSPRSASR